MHDDDTFQPEPDFPLLEAILDALFPGGLEVNAATFMLSAVGIFSFLVGIFLRFFQ